MSVLTQCVIACLISETDFSVCSVYVGYNRGFVNYQDYLECDTLLKHYRGPGHQCSRATDGDVYV